MSDTRTGLPRRAFLVTSCAAGCLAATACSAGTDPDAGTEPAADPVEIAASEVPLGGGIVLPGAKIVVTQPESGVYKAFSAICTHQGCVVLGVRNGAIECPCHYSRFSVTDGAVVSGPARRPLDSRTVTAAGDTLTIA